MELDDSQKQVVSNWIQEGLELSVIQRRLAEEFDIQMTYMEVRFLVGDLELTPKDAEPEPVVEEPPEPVAKPQPELPTTEDLPDGMQDLPVDDEALDTPAELDPDPGEMDPGGDISVTTDAVMRPGTMVSGKVTFSDGETCDWQVDQLGRMGIVPNKEGYRPSQEDMRKFSMKLEASLRRGGF